MPVQVRGEVLGIRRVGQYHVLTLTAPDHHEIPDHQRKSAAFA